MNGPSMCRLLYIRSEDKIFSQFCNVCKLGIESCHSSVERRGRKLEIMHPFAMSIYE